MITKPEKVVGKAAIWAIPLSDWERQRRKTEDRFEYQICTHTPYQTGAVKVADVEVSAMLPGGINLYQRAIQTLEEAKEERKRTYNEEISRINEQINSLLQLSWQPAEQPKEVEGEVLAAQEEPVAEVDLQSWSAEAAEVVDDAPDKGSQERDWHWEETRQDALEGEEP